MERTEHTQETMTPYAGDPLWNLLTQRWNLSLPITVGLVVTANAISVFGFGAVVSYWVHPQANIIRVFDPAHLYYALVCVFVYVPSIWLMYLWQPLGIAKTLHSLRQNDVIVETQDQSLETFTKRMNAALSNWLLLIAVTVVLLVGLLLETAIVLPTEAGDWGKVFFAFYDKRYYFLVFVPILYLTAYAAIMLAVKGVFALVWFNLLFRRFEARVHPLHPDGVGGFGPLGSLAVKYSLIAVGLGVVGTTLAVNRVLFGTGRLYLDSLLFWALYITLTPASLITPLWSAHQAMVRARNGVIDGVSSEFDKTLESLRQKPGRVGGSKKAWDKLDEFKARYTFVKDTYPTWPLSLAAFGRFSLAAALPLVTGIASIVINVMTR